MVTVQYIASGRPNAASPSRQIPIPLLPFYMSVTADKTLEMRNWSLYSISAGSAGSNKGIWIISHCQCVMNSMHACMTKLVMRRYHCPTPTLNPGRSLFSKGLKMAYVLWSRVLEFEMRLDDSARFQRKCVCVLGLSIGSPRQKRS